MKKLAIVLLVAAIAVFAAVRVQRASEAHQRWAAREQERLLLKGKVDNDRLAVRSAELSEQIAQSEGKKVDETATQVARTKLRYDESVLEMMEQDDRFNATLR